MPVTEDLRKTLSDPTPLYFAAGTADLAAEKLRGVPVLLERLRERAPERLDAVRNADLARVREQAQTLALQGVGRALEYAVRAREAYVELADRGRGAVESWRGAGEEQPAPYAYETHLTREPVDVTPEPAPMHKPEPEPATDQATAPATDQVESQATEGQATETPAAENSVTENPVTENSEPEQAAGPEDSEQSDSTR